MQLIGNLRNKTANLIEVLLSVILGITFALGLVPIAYVIYFYFWGWPHISMTHTGPLSGTIYAEMFMRLDVFLIRDLPLITTPLAVTALILRNKEKRHYWWLALPLLQVIWAVMNFLLPIAMLLD